MNPYNIQPLIDAQEDQDNRAKGLIDELHKFRDGIITELKVFIDQAERSGLKGTTSLSVVNLSNGKELQFGLAGYRIHMPVIDEVYITEHRYHKLLAYMLGYTSSSADSLPLVGFAITEVDQKPYFYQGHFVNFELNVNDNTPRMTQAWSEPHQYCHIAVEELTRWFYNYKQCWVSMPSYTSMVNNIPQKTWGFALPRAAPRKGL